MKTLTFLYYCCAIVTQTWALNSTRNFKIPLPVENALNNLEFVLNFTRYLHQTQHFNAFVTFCENRTTNKKSQNVARSLEKFLMDDFQAPLITWGMRPSVKLRNNIGLNNLVFIQIKSVEDPILPIVSQTMEGLHFMTMLFMFERLNGQHPTRAEIRTFFEWCWQENMINVALTFQVLNRGWNGQTRTAYVINEVYNYSPFPEFKVFNLTAKVNKGDVDGFIVDRIRNVNGYNFWTPLFADSPTVFLTPYERHIHKAVELFISGTAGRIFHEYVHFVNGSLNLRETHTNVSFYAYHKETLLLASHKEIDIGIHPYSALLPYANQTEGSYPIGQTNACIIVPLAPQIENGEYLFRALQPIIWVALWLELVSLCVIQCLYLRRFDFGNALDYALRTLLYQPLNLKDFEGRRTILRMIHLVLVMISILVNTSFSASLTSLLSATIMHDQITNVEEFLRTDLRIMVNRYEKEVYFDTNLLSNKLNSRLFLVNESLLFEHKEHLDNSFAYVVHTQEWQKLNFQQQLMWKPIFRIASAKTLCTANYFLRFPMQWDSPFALSVQLFFTLAQESGLDLAWERSSVYQAIRMKQMHIWHSDDADPTAFDMSHFYKALQVYCVLMSVAIGCFLAEIVRFYREEIKRKLNYREGVK